MKIREPAPFKDGGKHKWPVADVNLFEDQVLVDNNLIKRAGVKIDLNAEQRLEVMKCRIDPMYFIRTYCRIITLDHGLMPFNLYEFQEDMIRVYIENRWSVICTARQMGKCLKDSTMINIRSKKTGKQHAVSIHDFYEWQRFCKWVDKSHPELSKGPIR